MLSVEWLCLARELGIINKLVSDFSYIRNIMYMHVKELLIY